MQPSVYYTELISRIDSDQVTGACLVALCGGDVVGSLGLRLRGPGAYVNSLYVHSQHRGRGIGRRLLLRAAELSENYGKGTLGLAVHDENAPAQQLYRGLGFRPHEVGNEGYQHYIALLPLAAEAPSRYHADY